MPSNKQGNAVAMPREPLPDCTPDAMRLWLQDHSGESNLAMAYATAHNQTGWLMHELGGTSDPEFEKRYASWSKLESELCQRIIDILEIENPEEIAQRKSAGKGTHYVINPFMLRNGFSDGSGWWMGDCSDLHIE